MGLKTYFRKPGKDAQSPTEKGEDIPPTPTTPACYTPRSRESAGLEGIPMQRLNDAKCDVMVNHVWSEQAKLLWNIGNDDEGVVIKKSRGQYVTQTGWFPGSSPGTKCQGMFLTTVFKIL